MMARAVADPARCRASGSSAYVCVTEHCCASRRVPALCRAALWRSMMIVGVLTPLAVRAGARRRAWAPSSTATADQLGVPYLVFVAPAFLTAAALQIAAADAAYPIMAGFKWLRTFHGMAATPLSPAQICDGQLMWIAIRHLRELAGLPRDHGGVRRHRRAGWVVLAVPAADADRRWRSPRPIAALRRVARERGQRLQHAVPVRRHADVPVLRHVLPDQRAAGVGAVAGLRLPALARHRTGPRRGDRRTSPASRWSATSRICSVLLVVGLGARPLALPGDGSTK